MEFLKFLFPICFFYRFCLFNIAVYQLLMSNQQVFQEEDHDGGRFLFFLIASKYHIKYRHTLLSGSKVLLYIPHPVFFFVPSQLVSSLVEPPPPTSGNFIPSFVELKHDYEIRTIDTQLALFRIRRTHVILVFIEKHG